ncbi:MAG: hypothetical protein VSS52_003555, partial [Thiotrichaceae bacterium]|nr:hypothetical protein [Thiotrichaceae bacterium]
MMNKAISFNDLLEAINALSLDEQESLVDIIRHRIAERRREEVVKTAQEKYASDTLIAEFPEDLMIETLYLNSIPK